MTDPAIFKGTQQTVRISQTDGAIAATFQVDQFPPNEVTGVFRDGSILVLTISHGARPGLVENGAPVWSVMAMTLDGDTMRMAQMLERSQTIKRGTAKKLPN